MGGKGRRRRERNYLNAHGGNTRLPPPPNAKELVALPYKLRKIMKLKSFSVIKKGSSKEAGKEEKEDSSKDKKPKIKAARSSEFSNKENGDTEDTSKGNHFDDGNLSTESIAGANKRKRKRKSLKDLRFQELDQLAARSKRKERKKEYLKEKKKKNKKAKVDDTLDFPGKENIKFGEVVEAPPKLSFPKVSKPPMNASQERLRFQAIESYRNRRGWNSRPGIKLPSLADTLT
ncbi:hypothetical protein AXF42_Ash014469 [Apostasia shenzhenica]|uniref:Coiled-coil domain-containing protein 137 n=1 Tax=Apostasia shenzhenica TaxID=1088818 RepID=A0A2H9ZWP8_9ASPA|nr:hypothetical protein AXF42_Ash014469 [Apostasia shenzhenica]